MYKDSFLIFFQPHRTLDRLLFEENQRRSWGATWLLAGVSSLGILLAFLLVGGSVLPELKNQSYNAAQSQTVFLSVLIGGWIVLTALSVGILVLARFVFTWFVQLGLRMVAGQQVPHDAEERRHKAKLVQLIQPYTMGIQQYPNLIMSMLTLLFIGDSISSAMHPNVVPQITASFIAGLIVKMLAGLINLGMFIYMIVVRVFAIQKIYGVSGAQAFWGPFLVYFLVDLILIILFVIFAVMIVTMIPHLSDQFSNTSQM